MGLFSKHADKLNLDCPILQLKDASSSPLIALFNGVRRSVIGFS